MCSSIIPPSWAGGGERCLYYILTRSLWYLLALKPNALQHLSLTPRTEAAKQTIWGGRGKWECLFLSGGRQGRDRDTWCSVFSSSSHLIWFRPISKFGEGCISHWLLSEVSDIYNALGYMKSVDGVKKYDHMWWHGIKKKLLIRDVGNHIHIEKGGKVSRVFSQPCLARV